MHERDVTIPPDILQWLEGDREQWLADELWGLATEEQDPAPAAFVRAFRRCARLVSSGASAVRLQDLDAEQTVLGAILLEGRETFLRVSNTLNAPAFYVEKHRLIFEGMRALAARGESVDLLTVADELRSTSRLDQAGGPAVLAQLVEHASIATNLDRYVRIVRENA